MAELVPGGEKDSVVYLGKSSFKMKVGVRMTPPAEAAPTVPPTPRVSQTPRPMLRTPPSAQGGSHSRPGVAPEGQSAQLVQGVSLAKSTLVGLCLTAFSCGIMCTVAVDRYWPRARTECVGTQPGTSHAAAPADPVIEAPARPGPGKGSSADVVSLPPYGEKLPTADKVVAVAAAAVAPAAVPPTPALAVAAPPRARPVASPSPALRAAAPVRLAPAQGRTVVRKRPGPTTAAVDTSASSPTETWTDPFAE